MHNAGVASFIYIFEKILHYDKHLKSLGLLKVYTRLLMHGNAKQQPYILYVFGICPVKTGLTISIGET